MGMFDYIQVELVLPEKTEVVDTTFQTKSFDNLMQDYIITADGLLVRDHWDMVWVDDDNAFFKGHLQRVEGSHKQIHLTDFHGDIRFYNGVPEVMGSSFRSHEGGVWRDYIARFTDGKLTRMWFEDEHIIPKQL